MLTLAQRVADKMDIEHNDPGMADDVTWFMSHPVRLSRIRNPWPGEMWNAFQALGMHDANRRRILTWKAPSDGVLYRVPMIAFSDETIENEDAILLPMLDDMMKPSARRQAN